MPEKMELKSIKIDLEKKSYELNGQKMNGISSLILEFNNGSWTLLVTKDELYSQAASNRSTV